MANFCNHPSGCNTPQLAKYKSTEPGLCVFHAPIEKKRVSRDRYAEYVKQRIDNETGPFVECIFPWTIKFIDLYPKEITKPIEFRKCSFEGNDSISLTLKAGILTDTFCIDFDGLDIKNRCVFEECQFNNSINFILVKFYSQLSFKKSKANGAVYFEDVRIINADANFEFQNVERNAFFGGMEFGDRESKYIERRNISFAGAKFKGNVYFSNNVNIFAKHVQFNAIECNGQFLIFDDIQIDCYKLNFFEAQINCSSSFQFRRATVVADLVYFYHVYFNTSVTFEDTEFKRLTQSFDVHLSFMFTEFCGNDLSFLKTKFNCGEVYFNSAIFCCQSNFHKTEFNEGVIFDKAKFSKFGINETRNFNKDTDFKTLTVRNENEQSKIEFSNTVFRGSYADFSNCNFLCDLLAMEECIFECQINFIKDILISEFHLNVRKSLFSSNALFYFKSPHFKINSSPIIVTFENIKFSEYNTFFEDIRPSKIFNENDVEIIYIFRYCILNDVYFTNNYMTLFSFYKSEFDKAILTSNDWYARIERLFPFVRYTRYNVLIEDLLYRKLLLSNSNNQEITLFQLHDLRRYDEIANMYRKLKTASDSTKDFPQAGKFYFNEFEMCRLGLRYEVPFRLHNWLIEKCKKIVEGKRIDTKHKFYVFLQRCNGYLKTFTVKPFKRLIFCIYKLISGYGEKPLWTVISFILFWAIFSGLNMLNGFSVGKDKGYFYYKFEWSSIDISTWINDFLSSSMLTLYRMFPSSYFPFGKGEYSILGRFGNFGSPFLNLLNSAILILLLGFFLMSLKRFFRRF